VVQVVQGYLKNNQKRLSAWLNCSSVEHLPSKHEALNLTSNTEKEKKDKGNSPAPPLLFSITVIKKIVNLA
jgi:hypothetical protein